MLILSHLVTILVLLITCGGTIRHWHQQCTWYVRSSIFPDWSVVVYDLHFSDQEKELFDIFWSHCASCHFSYCCRTQMVEVMVGGRRMYTLWQKERALHQTPVGKKGDIREVVDITYLSLVVRVEGGDASQWLQLSYTCHWRAHHWSHHSRTCRILIGSPSVLSYCNYFG